jgi:peptidoglycan/xylan/chitin deacetylase (PgdA/CDA1 family)
MMKKIPVLLTFDVDGECIWLCRDPENAKRPVTLSLGQYGIEEGVPRIKKLLEKYRLPATFFVPGFIADKYPEVVKGLAEVGEIGNHSWTHTYPDNMESREVEEWEYSSTSDLLEKLTGKRPIGYRSPAWEFSEYTIDILEKMGDIQYSSNMMNTDRVKYLKVGGRESSLVELPIHWVLDDAAFWLYSVRIPGKAIQPVEAVESFWKTEFEALYEEFIEEVNETGHSDICFVLTCHPQVIGRPARMKALERLIQYIQGHANVEFMTAGALAKRFKEENPK